MIDLANIWPRWYKVMMDPRSEDPMKNPLSLFFVWSFLENCKNFLIEAQNEVFQVYVKLTCGIFLILSIK